MALRIYRLAHWLWRKRVPLLPWLLRAFNRIVFSTILPPSARIGRNVLLSYEGLGTVIHLSAVIGDGAVIGTGVTIGGRSGKEGAPIIGANAMIGSGAKILGAVRIGVGASIGANAVVLNDVPDYGVAAGVPAKLIRIDRPGEQPDYFAFRKEGQARA